MQRKPNMPEIIWYGWHDALSCYCAQLANGMFLEVSP